MYYVAQVAKIHAKILALNLTSIFPPETATKHLYKRLLAIYTNAIGA